MTEVPFTLTELQWALLIFGVVAVLLVVVFSRRDRGGVKTDARGSRVISQPRVEEPATYGIGGEFDEFGVGRPRRRGDARPAARMPQLNIEPGPVRAAPPPEKKVPSYMNQPAPSARRTAPTVAPAPEAPAPVERKAAPLSPPAHAHSPAPASAPASPGTQRKADERIVTLLVARSNGVAMPGAKIHASVAACGLGFGPMQIYHRKQEGKRVFSVASLMKPGFLIPEDAEGFSTMALSVFMVLPGPVEGTAAFEDMLRTAQRLAEGLEAELYDDRKQVLTPQAIQKLRGEIKAWAAGAGATP